MSLTRVEAQQRAAALTVSSYDIALDLAADPDHRTFGSRTTVRFTTPGGDTFLELRDATGVEATLDGTVLEGYDGRRIRLADLAAGEHVVSVTAVLPTSTDGEAMYRFTDPADGEGYLSAHVGMDLAQRVFACFDQPDLKAPIRLEVTAPEQWTVLANGVPAEPTGAAPGEGARRWQFSATPAISTYLFVVCAGPWHSRTFSHAGLPFGWHARASLADALDRDFEELRGITTACFDHYARVFEPAYAFDSYDQVFVPGLNWGALETPGCVTFRDEMLSRGQMTPSQRQHRATVIAHEMAHMWFGDLVTMRWWEDSWLNESFADHMGYQVAGAATGFDGAWTAAALTRKPTAYVADSRRSTHPVAEDAEAVTDVDTAFGNFDMITYAKGNALLRQLVTWLGEDEFLAGVNRYLTAHAFGNADLADFLDALDGATDRDFRGWAATWLRTTGFDTVRVERTRDDPDTPDGPEVPVLVRTGSRPHRFHVGGYDESGMLVAGRTVDLADRPVPLPELAGLAVLPNDRDETYARLAPDAGDWAALSGTVSTIADPLTRALVWATAVDMTATGRLSVDTLVGLVAGQLASEPDSLVLGDLLSLVCDRVLRQYAAPGEVETAHDRVAAACRAVLGGPDEGRHLAVLPTLASTSTDADELLGWLRDGRTRTGDPVEPDLRWSAVRRLAALGACEESLIESELSRDGSSAAHLGAAHARAARPTVEAKERAWSLMHGEVSNREYEAISAGFWTPGQHALVAPWLSRYLDDTLALARRRAPGFAGSVLRLTFPLVPLPTPALERLRSDLAAHLAGELPTTLRRPWEDRLDDLDVMLQVRRAAQGTE